MPLFTSNGIDYTTDLLEFAQKLVQIQSYSGQEEQVIRCIAAKMQSLGFEDVTIDRFGNVYGRIGDGDNVILFDSHVDTVKVLDEDLWEVPPFSGAIIDGYLWGRGSVDMKSSAAASIYAAVMARQNNFLVGKTVYVSCTVFEEDCDGEGLKLMLEEANIRPNHVVICEPSGNVICTGHKGKAQIKIKTKGVSAHGSAPEKGVNAIYEMAEIIQRVEQTNLELMKTDGRKGTLVISQISSQSVSLNAVPFACEIYLDRRTVVGETETVISAEMDKIIAGKNATWEVGTLHRTTWTGEPLVYQPLHLAWETDRNHAITQAFIAASTKIFGKVPDQFDYWDFSTNAVAVVGSGIPTIGFGPGEYKLAHMRNEKCAISQIIDACRIYAQVILNL